jgi:hypothetical protein
MVRCIDTACGHVLPRRVHFCPYCGTAQEEGRTQLQAPAPVVADAAADKPPREAILVAAAISAAASRADTPAPVTSEPAPGPAAAPVPPPIEPPAPPARAQSPFPRAEPAAGAAPPRREPVRLRWWLLALAALWAIWLIAKPSNRRIEAQMDKAIALATECKAREAQSELIALRGTKAKPEQLQRVQSALNEASATCTRKRQRDKAWREAKTAVESALSTASFERARTRLRTFTKRWGEDEATRAMKEEIDARQPEHPRAAEVEEGKMR